MEFTMNITKTLSSLSLAFALVGGTFVFAPAKAEAGNNGFISFDALKKNQIGKNGTRPGQAANKWTRGCSAIQRCRG
jgi:hypothetical protein